MTAAAIYARVSSARQAKDETIGSQLAALREHAAQSRLDVPEEWVFQDEGHSGATLVRPALEALRDLVAQGCVDVVLVYSPDRLARKFAYQALLIEELARCGVRVEFVKGPRGDGPEDQLLVQFQGMFAEYENNADIGIVLDMPSPRLCRLGPVPGGFELLRTGAGVAGVGIIAAVSQAFEEGEQGIGRPVASGFGAGWCRPGERRLFDLEIGVQIRAGRRPGVLVTEPERYHGGVHARVK